MTKSNHTTAEIVRSAQDGLKKIENGKAAAGLGQQQIAAAIMELIAGGAVNVGGTDRKTYTMEMLQRSANENADIHKDARKFVVTLILGPAPVTDKDVGKDEKTEKARAEYRARQMSIVRGWKLAALLAKEYSHVDFTDKGFKVTVADIVPDGKDAVRLKHDTPIVLDNKATVLVVDSKDKLTTIRASVDSLMRAYTPAGQTQRVGNGLTLDKALDYIAKNVKAGMMLTDTQREKYNAALAALAAINTASTVEAFADEAKTA